VIRLHLILLAVILSANAGCAADRARVVSGNALADDRAVSRRRTRAVDGVAGPPMILYIAQVNGGIWRATTQAARGIRFSMISRRIGRRDRRRAERSEHHLRRQRRRPASAGRVGRQRNLQIERRRQDLDAPRPRRRTADSAIASIRAIRSRLRAALGHPYGPNSQRGVFRSHRWRQNVEAHSLQGRQHRRVGSQIDPRIRTRSTRLCGSRDWGRSRTSNEFARHRRRAFQIDRRRETWKH